MNSFIVGKENYASEIGENMALVHQPSIPCCCGGYPEAGYGDWEGAEVGDAEEDAGRHLRADTWGRY